MKTSSTTFKQIKPIEGLQPDRRNEEEKVTDIESHLKHLTMCVVKKGEGTNRGIGVCKMFCTVRPTFQPRLNPNL